MAVSCYKCEYFSKSLEEQFMLFGGDRDWIKYGLKKVDPKLSQLSLLNEAMAFRPWYISSLILKDILKGDNKLSVH
eukprot:CAMPEP_0116888690 /NCGR_PEP_ID=MMETSP0463-20121206/23849_1 /TAXON_ID=181622 /ORGANISM="Strombidinopsis sp, Strain SopsisLIS2011" /LENGTH=75 /DNA_ID=CAMNT_0004553981 /DNA_START=268 /DNA_END=495 /DNA_ORIENTATION=-